MSGCVVYLNNCFLNRERRSTFTSFSFKISFLIRFLYVNNKNMNSWIKYKTINKLHRCWHYNHICRLLAAYKTLHFPSFAPWRKYRIGIYSEPIRTIPISVSEPMRIIPNQSKTRFVTRLMKNGKKLIQPSPRQQSKWIRTNPKPSFQSESMRMNLRWK